SSFQPQFDAIKLLESLIDDLLKAADNAKSTKVQRVIAMLVRITARSFHDLVILVGNGAGIGAMILTRGMFEYMIMAEYLRLNPREYADYLALGVVSAWQRYRKMKADSPQRVANIHPEAVARFRKRYSRSAARLKDQKGKVRRQWHRKSLRQMAQE